MARAMRREGLESIFIAKIMGITVADVEGWLNENSKGKVYSVV